jgi:hypothetical protein
MYNDIVKYMNKDIYTKDFTKKKKKKKNGEMGP